MTRVSGLAPDSVAGMSLSSSCLADLIGVTSPLSFSPDREVLPPERMPKSGWLHSSGGATDLDVFTSADLN